MNGLVAVDNRACDRLPRLVFISQRIAKGKFYFSCFHSFMDFVASKKKEMKRGMENVFLAGGGKYEFPWKKTLCG